MAQAIRRFHFSQLSSPVIIQAPMAGGANTPALVAAVANAGGVGSFGFAYATPAKIEADLTAARHLSPSGVINANFFVFKDVAPPSEKEQDLALQVLRELDVANHLGKDPSIPCAPFFPNVQEMLEPVWALKPDILTFHLGLPKPSWLRQAHDLGISVGASATCLQEALEIESAGIDFIVAQGSEAGGHRGTFDADPKTDERLTCLDLVKQLASAPSVTLPIVAAGGIMDGSDICRMIQVGASAVQCGTAFLTCDESGASPAHKHFLQFERSRGTTYTRGFSGRWAQGIQNRFIEQMQTQSTLPFPIQNTLTGPLRSEAGQRGDGENQSLWAGSGYAKTRQMPASELMAQLQREYKVEENATDYSNDLAKL